MQGRSFSSSPNSSWRTPRWVRCWWVRMLMRLDWLFWLFVGRSRWTNCCRQVFFIVRTRTSRSFRKSGVYDEQLLHKPRPARAWPADTSGRGYFPTGSQALDRSRLLVADYGPELLSVTHWPICSQIVTVSTWTAYFLDIFFRWDHA